MIITQRTLQGNYMETLKLTILCLFSNATSERILKQINATALTFCLGVKNRNPSTEGHKPYCIPTEFGWEGSQTFIFLTIDTVAKFSSIKNSFNFVGTRLTENALKPHECLCTHRDLSLLEQKPCTLHIYRYLQGGWFGTQLECDG